MGRHFVIKTDHFSLQYLLEHIITTIFQSKWLSKLMRYDYEIRYKRGKENTAADSLSRLLAAQLLTLSLTSVHTSLIEEVKLSWEQDDNIQSIVTKIESGEVVPHYSLSQGLLYRKGRLVVGSNAALQTKIIPLFHDSALGGHSGVAVSL